jgi:hypothetical protein
MKLRKGTNTSELENATQILTCIQLLQGLPKGIAGAAPRQVAKLRQDKRRRLPTVKKHPTALAIDLAFYFFHVAESENALCKAHD